MFLLPQDNTVLVVCTDWNNWRNPGCTLISFFELGTALVLLLCLPYLFKQLDKSIDRKVV